MAAPCPRCGYDLRGFTVAWTSACPLRGRCVECGYGFAWCDVFAQERHPWLFEAEWRYRPLARIARTAMRSLSPTRFWRDVRMTDRIFLTPAFALVLGASLLFVVVHAAFLSQPWRGAPGTNPVTWIALAIEAIVYSVAVAVYLAPAPLVVLFGMPLAFLCVPVTLRRARVRRAHIVRIWFYSLLAPILVATLWTVALLASMEAGAIEVFLALNPWEWYRWAPGVPNELQLFAHWLLPGLVLTAALAAWQARWWHVAMTRYLEMPRPNAMIVALVIMVTLAALTVEMYTFVTVRW